MQKHLVEHLQWVMNHGPFGFTVSYPSVRGHVATYCINVMYQGEVNEVWQMETPEGEEILAELIQDFILKGDDYYIVQAEIYRALCCEIASVVKESEVDESLARILNLEYPQCYITDKPRCEGK